MTDRHTAHIEHYHRLKQLLPGRVLFLRDGDFYSLFSQDAALSRKVLGITLSYTVGGIELASVPYHAVEKYIRPIAEAGYRCAVCEDTADLEAERQSQAKMSDSPTDDLWK